MRWYALNDSSSWKFSDGVNERFQLEVRAIRAMFRLKKVKLGVEESTGIWLEARMYETGKVIYGDVKRFEWLGWGPNENVRFGFQVQLAEEDSSGSACQVLSGDNVTSKRLKKVWDCPLEVSFPHNYPDKNPEYYVKDKRYLSFSGSAHEHHLQMNGHLCIFGETGDWRNDDLAVSGLLSAFDHAYWHYSKFRW